jgi:opacity protein-like surface antigen
MHRNVIFVAGAALALAAIPASAADDVQPPASAATSQVQQEMPAGQGGWAVVGAAGKLERGRNATGAQHLGKGQYEVDFNSGVGKCAYTATIAGRKAQGKIAPGFIVVQHRSGTPNGIFVATFLTTTLTPADYRFHLNVTC